MRAKDGKIFFEEFDFTHGAFVSARSEKQEFLLRAYKSKMTAGEFIEGWKKLAVGAKHANQYTNPHKAHERYLRLDDRFNFFGNYG